MERPTTPGASQRASASSERLDELLTVRDFERAARRVLSRNALDYFRSGADGQATLRANERAFRRWSLLPRVLVDVTNVDTRVTLLGTSSPSPVLVAPTAYHCMAHPDGERATARAAQAAGVVYVVSTLATTSLADVAVASGAGPRWFQLYVHKDRGLTRELVARAEANGYGALVLTVDTPLLGRRLADVRNGFCLPDGMYMPNLVSEAEAAAASAAGQGGSYLAKYVASRHDPSLGWKDVEWLRGLTRLPLVLKGIVRADDAARGVSAGARGVIVSNHGGRQLDGTIATLDALPAIVDAVGASAEVLVDGGVRWGTDVLKALALGARAVLVGRPVLWGLAVGGEAGVARVLEILRDELALAMALAGCPDVRAVTRDLVTDSRASSAR